jgi:hypothetical protein
LRAFSRFAASFSHSCFLLHRRRVARDTGATCAVGHPGKPLKRKLPVDLKLGTYFVDIIVLAIFATAVTGDVSAIKEITDIVSKGVPANAMSSVPNLT